MLSNTDTQHGENLLENTLKNVVRLSFNFEHLNKQVIEEEPALGIESIIEKFFKGFYLGNYLVQFKLFFIFPSAKLEELWVCV